MPRSPAAATPLEHITKLYSTAQQEILEAFTAILNGKKTVKESLIAHQIVVLQALRQ